MSGLRHSIVCEQGSRMRRGAFICSNTNWLCSSWARLWKMFWLKMHWRLQSPKAWLASQPKNETCGKDSLTLPLLLLSTRLCHLSAPSPVQHGGECRTPGFKVNLRSRRVVSRCHAQVPSPLAWPYPLPGWESDWEFSFIICIMLQPHDPLLQGRLWASVITSLNDTQCLIWWCRSWKWLVIPWQRRKLGAWMVPSAFCQIFY